MTIRRHRTFALAATLLLSAGCGDLGQRATIYRAERQLWEAQREEARTRLGGAKPDSATLAQLRARFARLRETFPVPKEAAPGSPAEAHRIDLVRILGNAELVGIKLALQARQPEQALDRARWILSVAGRDTLLRREAQLRQIDAFQALRRYDEAVDTVWAMLDYYKPVPPRKLGEEDPILRMPGFVVALHEELGDTAQVRADRRRALGYFNELLASGPTPLLESQIRVHAVSMQLGLGDRRGALESLDAIERLVQTVPELSERQAELLFTRGGVLGMPGGDYKAALETYDSIVKRHADTPFAPRAMLEAAVLEERIGNKRAALVRYRGVVERYSSHEGVAPLALFRSAMLKDLLGDWAGAKQDLDGLPLRYPKSRAALEAPLAVVSHYQRTRERDAYRAALLRAVDTYRGLIEADTASMMNVAFRWNIARCYVALDRTKDALSTIDEMGTHDQRNPLTGVALREGARLAVETGEPARARVYLERYLAAFPKSRDAAQVRAQLERMSGER